MLLRHSTLIFRSIESKWLPTPVVGATNELPYLTVPLKNRLDLTRLAELDRQFCEFSKLQREATPRCGWTKTVRLALGMSSNALGSRLGVTGQGVRKLEEAEADGSITLKTLSRLAHGLDCDVHYIFIPRTSLVEQLLKRTHQVAGIPMPPMPKVAEVLREAETLEALSVALNQVKKRGLW